MARITARAPSGQDYSDKLNEIVKISDVDADGFIEVTLVTDSSADDNEGVIESVDVNGNLTVLLAGEEAHVFAQSAVTIGTHKLVMAGNASRAVPATAGNNYLGRVIGPAKDVASGQYVRVLIQPGTLPA